MNREALGSPAEEERDDEDGGDHADDVLDHGQLIHIN